MRQLKQVHQRLLRSFSFSLSDEANKECAILKLGDFPFMCWGSLILEMGALSWLTSDPLYEFAALRAFRKLWSMRSSLNLLGRTLDVTIGEWIEYSSRIGAGMFSLVFDLLMALGSVLLHLIILHRFINRTKRFYRPWPMVLTNWLFSLNSFSSTFMVCKPFCFHLWFWILCGLL